MTHGQWKHNPGQPCLDGAGAQLVMVLGSLSQEVPRRWLGWFVTLFKMPRIWEAEILQG